MRSYKPLKIIIIGGVAAGMSAAMRARRNDHRAEITVIQKEDEVSYGSCGLPYFIAGRIPRAADLLARTKEDFKKHNINVLTGHEALSLQHIKKQINIRRLSDGKISSLIYDRLIIATGARPQKAGIPGAQLKNVFYLRTWQDGVKLDHFIKNENPKNAVIIGSGYIGLEMTEALTARGLKVRIIEQNEHVLSSVDPEISEEILNELGRHNCDVFLSNSVKQITGYEQVEQVILSSGGQHPADMVLVATGIQPNVEFLKDSGIQLGKSGAIAVNSKMQTNLFGVYAAGDCAEVKNLVTNRNDYIPLGTTANKQGKTAGDNASGRFSQFKGVVATAAVKVFDLQVGRTGLSEKDALNAGYKYKTVFIKSSSRPGYSPCKKPLNVKLIFQKPGGRLLGAQISGGEGVAKRIDIFATALHQKMTVYDIAELDLSYAPPFAPVWDPVIIAANEAVKKL
ncbi:MAG: FAD-dependent oxidoreductase [Calditrichaeota bacterium]|nr:FAD-dependent oxidoreductase [Calditrichota bacterium]